MAMVLPDVDGMQQSLMRLEAVSRTFVLGDSKIRALHDVSLEIRSGDFLAVWGPSGSGKSTLLNLLGLIDHPDSGSVFLCGTDVTHLSDNALSDFRNRQIGFVFQSFNLIPVLSALENVMLPLQLQKMKTRDMRERALQSLCGVGLERFIHHPPEKLSGGQRQRVAIARAVVTQPALVIADEPTANLDSRTSREMLDLMQSLNEGTGIAFVFSTHDPRLLERTPRRLFMSDGCLSVTHPGESGIASVRSSVGR